MPFILDLFDDLDSDPSGTEPDDGIKPSDTGVQHPGQRRSNGKFQSVNEGSNVDSEIRLRDLETKLADRNEENRQRRVENKQLKESVESQTKQFQAISQKALRSEARVALAEAGVIHADVVDIFLKRSSDKVKVDSDFEVQGLSEALEAFRTSHPQFFKLPEPAKDEKKLDKKLDEKKPADTSDDDNDPDPRKNATSRGASLRGAFSNRRGSAKADESKSGDDVLNEYLSTIR